MVLVGDVTFHIKTRRAGACCCDHNPAGYAVTSARRKQKLKKRIRKCVFMRRGPFFREAIENCWFDDYIAGLRITGDQRARHYFFFFGGFAAGAAELLQFVACVPQLVEAAG